MHGQRSSRPADGAAVCNALSAGDVAQLASGARVHRYQILAVVGRGGMGEV